MKRNGLEFRFYYSLYVFTLFGILATTWGLVMYYPFVKSIHEGLCNVTNITIIPWSDDIRIQFYLTWIVDEYGLRDDSSSCIYTIVLPKDETNEFIESLGTKVKCFYGDDHRKYLTLSYGEIYNDNYIPIFMYVFAGLFFFGLAYSLFLSYPLMRRKRSEEMIHRNGNSIEEMGGKRGEADDQTTGEADDETTGEADDETTFSNPDVDENVLSTRIESLHVSLHV